VARDNGYAENETEARRIYGISPKMPGVGKNLFVTGVPFFVTGFFMKIPKLFVFSRR
jgi:hypothetical protein